VADTLFYHHKGIEHRMSKRSLVLLTLVATMFCGCTPFGEDILRKGTGATAPEEGKNVVQTESRQAETPVDPTTKKILHAYGPTIRLYAARYGFDWRLILATMKQESRFSPLAESHRGASGLMQIMPATSEEVARALDVENLSYPENNIRGGIYYLRGLYELFKGAQEGDRIKLTLAAYNAGIGRIFDAQEIAAYLHENPLEWESIKDALPLLSRHHGSLHKGIWNTPKPKSGWFGNSRETITYVESVMNHYDEYRQMLN
jgi:membrane-bound lytic murein transglycosylase MltF